MAEECLVDKGDFEINEYPWHSIFEWCQTPYYGLVYDMDDASDLIQEFSYQTSTTYNVTRTSKDFGSFNFAETGEKKHVIRFHDDRKIKHGSPISLDGMPFMVVGHRLMECHQGPQHRKGSTDEVDGDHPYQLAAHKKKVTGSKKRGCPAAIYLREVVAFPTYQIPQNTAYHRAQKSAQLRRDMASPDFDATVMRVIFIDLPPTDKHNFHIMGDAANLKLPVDARVVSHVNTLVEDGVFSIHEMKRHVKIFVKNLFGNDPLPKQINRRFYPSRSDLRKMIYRQRCRLQKGLLDQENLSTKLDQWKMERPSDDFFFRASSSVQQPTIEDAEDCGSVITDADQTLLFIYQTSWQKKLLLRYGQDTVFLDATYRTTKYALPLFFLCVHTNSGYIVVATLIMETEDSTSLSEALSHLKKMNPLWNPVNFMIDASDLEEKAITEVFPGRNICICDFHMKQAWRRWTSSLKNNVSHCQDEILKLLHQLAESLTEQEYDQNLQNLKKSDVWTKNPRFQRYLENEWLKNDRHKKWVWAFRSQSMMFVVTTNNGIESQNNVFKHEYLAPFRVKSLTGLVSCLVDDFFVDSYRSYLESNVTMSAGWREALPHIPDFLHHRPLNMVRHIRTVSAKAADISSDMVQSMADGTFEVDSKGPNTYIVSLGSDGELVMPSCQCREFQKSHLICKHFCAVFQHCDVNWNSLPEFYRNNPLFVVDSDCVCHTAEGVAIMRDSSVSLDGASSTCNPSTTAQIQSERSDCDPIPDTSSSEKINLVSESGTDDFVLSASHPAGQSEVNLGAKRIRQATSRINSLSYLCTSTAVLRKAKESLDQIIKDLLNACPKEGGILLVPQETKQSIKQKKPCKVKSLPLRKKRRKLTKSSFNKVSVGSSEEQNLPSVPLNDRNRLLGSLELNQDDVLKHNSIMEGVHLVRFANEGNSCWFNSTIQAVFHTLLSSDSARPKRNDSFNVIDAVLSLYKVCAAQPDLATVATSSHLASINETCKFIPNTQQDAGEFLAFLLSEMIELGIFQPVKTSWATRMLDCKHVSVQETLASVLHLSLAVPLEDGTDIQLHSIEECLYSYFNIEEEIAMKCSRDACGKEGRALKKQSLLQCGKYLLVSLMRFKQSHSGAKKMNVPVKINRMIHLNKKPYVLQALQCHHGVHLNAGHYTTVLFKDEVAFLCDDDHIYKQKTVDVLNEIKIQRECYILWYTEVGAPTKKSKDCSVGEQSITYRLRDPKIKKKKRESWHYPEVFPKSSKDGKSKKVYCYCRKPAGKGPMIACDNCNEWYHLRCVSMKKSECDSLVKWYCPSCNKQPALEMNVNDLPSEILDKILFGAMESEEDPFALTATLVCRRWRDIMMPRLKKQKTKQKTEHQDLLECLEAFADPYKSGNVRNSLKGFKFKPPVLLQEDELRDCLAPEYRSSEEPCYDMKSNPLHRALHLDESTGLFLYGLYLNGVRVKVDSSQSFLLLTEEQFNVFDQWKEHRQGCQHIPETAHFLTRVLYSWLIHNKVRYTRSSFIVNVNIEDYEKFLSSS